MINPKVYIENTLMIYETRLFLSFLGILIGMGENLVYIGLLLIFLYFITLKRKRLIYIIFWRDYQLKLLFFINLIFGLVLGYNQTLLSESYAGVIFFSIIPLSYLNAKYFKLVIINAIDKHTSKVIN